METKTQNHGSDFDRLSRHHHPALSSFPLTKATGYENTGKSNPSTFMYLWSESYEPLAGHASPAPIPSICLLRLCVHSCLLHQNQLNSLLDTSTRQILNILKVDLRHTYGRHCSRHHDLPPKIPHHCPQLICSSKTRRSCP